MVAVSLFLLTVPAHAETPTGLNSIVLVNSGDIDDALAEAEAVLLDNPFSEEALIARAYIRAIHLDDGRGALSDLRRLAAVSSAEDDPFHGAGYSRLVLEEIDKAVEFYGTTYGIMLDLPTEPSQ